MSVAKAEVIIPAPELRGAIPQITQCSELELGVDGPAGTGKTFGILYLIHILLLNFPGTKWLVARKHNTDLSGSAMATYRENVLDPRENIRYFGGNKVEPPKFRYPNGSQMIVSGLDKAEKVRSMDFDGAYINEATECELTDVETLSIRLARRANSALPKQFQKLLMDFNPDAPTHFLNQRMNAGITRRILSRHEDNPFLYDAVNSVWTPEGERYISLLDRLTGVRLARYRYGIWASAEGTVYEDSWDRARNVIDAITIPREWPRYLAIDFGFTHPFVCLWAAVDPDGRIYIYRQIYMTKKLVEDNAKDIAIASGWHDLLPKDHPKYKARMTDTADPLPQRIICDHDAEGRATLERYLGLYTTPAKKTVSDGIQAVAARFRLAGDGKPRLMVLRNSLYERDQELTQAKKPTCLEEEPESYVWRVGGGIANKEEPVKEYDHALDCCRYLCAYFDLDNDKITYFPSIWR